MYSRILSRPGGQFRRGLNTRNTHIRILKKLWVNIISTLCLHSIDKMSMEASNTNISTILFNYTQIQKEKFMTQWAKYQLDRRRLRQALKAIPDITWRLPLGYCQNPGELVLSEGRNYKLFFVLFEANPILLMTPRDGCAM